MVQTENHACEICDSTEIEQISTKGRDYIKTYTSICKNCGFVFLSPRMSSEDYLKFYTTEYDKYYRTNNFGIEVSDDEMSKNPYGFQPVIERLKANGFNAKDPRVLAIGGGDGNNLAYLGRKFDTTQLFSIEPSEMGREASESKGIETLAADALEDWEVSVKGSLDLIVLRHVLEHLPDLNTALQKIHAALKDDGLLYIAVPNSYDIGKMTLLRDFFRIVHLSYFSKRSLSNLIHKNKFKILEVTEHNDTNSELYLVATKSDHTASPIIDNSEYKKQRAYFDPIIEKESSFVERFKSLRTYLNRRYVILKSTLFNK